MTDTTQGTPTDMIGADRLARGLYWGRPCKKASTSSASSRTPTTARLPADASPAGSRRTWIRFRKAMGWKWAKG